MGIKNYTTDNLTSFIKTLNLVFLICLGIKLQQSDCTGNEYRRPNKNICNRKYTTNLAIQHHHVLNDTTFATPIVYKVNNIDFGTHDFGSIFLKNMLGKH
jgi:hypothetical protein